MYVYDQYDQKIVEDRVKQFRDQTRRYLAGELSGEEFRPLRLQNGLYIQRYAPMLRVAVPYGLLSSTQVRMLAKIARDYDKGYAHISTRQNVQFNWPDLEDVPEILAELATVQMHAIQTSGNCIRNTTTDQFAGVAKDEIVDPRPWCEIIRQWSTFHPEFSHLPRKFKIAVNGAVSDRAAIEVHDIGLEAVKNEAGELGFRVSVGGGLGRTPIVGSFIKEFLPWQHLLGYLDAILRVYNRYGRRDNKYKARIKILVKALGIEAFAAEVEREWQPIKDGPAQLTEDEYQRVAASFHKPAYVPQDALDLDFGTHLARDEAFARWVSRNVMAHQVPGYLSVVLSTKPGISAPPGDVSTEQMEALADWSERYGFGEIRVAHEQNLVLPDVRKADLYALWREAEAAGLGTANAGLLTDIIACPGGDFCSLANAKSIPIAQAIQQRFDDLDYLHDLGELSLNISGCMNACGHHHIGNIGILGVDKNGSEWYQLTLGGSQGQQAALGKVIGPSFAAEQVPEVIERIVRTYVDQREVNEGFLDTFQRIGLEPFKTSVYSREEVA